MAITKSAKKALRQNKRRHERNLLKKKNLKSLIKKLKTLIALKKADEAENLLPQVYQALDKTAKTGLIKKNTASRKKSRLAKALAKIKQLKQ